jgi:preprotein translocase subunit SecG
MGTEIMETILLIVHVLIGASVIGLVLIQQGKGADAGASFGGGASQTVFGSAGAGSFLVKLTAGLAALFFATSLALAVLAKQKADAVGTFGLPEVPEEGVQTAPQEPVAPKTVD